MTHLRMCGYAWSDCAGKLGSNHACGLEHGHVGDHDCLSCHTIAKYHSPLVQAVNDSLFEVPHFKSLAELPCTKCGKPLVGHKQNTEKRDGKFHFGPLICPMS